jgi:hypothetical protein
MGGVNSTEVKFIVNVRSAVVHSGLASNQHTTTSRCDWRKLSMSCSAEALIKAPQVAIMASIDRSSEITRIRARSIEAFGLGNFKQPEIRNVQ